MVPRCTQQPFCTVLYSIPEKLYCRFHKQFLQICICQLIFWPNSFAFFTICFKKAPAAEHFLLGGCSIGKNRFLPRPTSIPTAFVYNLLDFLNLSVKWATDRPNRQTFLVKIKVSTLFIVITNRPTPTYE